MNYVTVPNFEQWQHYKDRTPPWIKLHRDLLRKYDFSLLPDKTKAHLMLIWLLASQMDNRVPDDAAFIQRMTGMVEKPDIKSLVEKGFLDRVADCKHVASDPLAGRTALSNAREAEEEEEERKKPRAKPAGLEDLSVDHIADWLARKRSEGKYVHHDEHFIIEYFKDWCRSKGNKYDDYIAALRNAFEWKSCQPKPQGGPGRGYGVHQHAQPKSKFDLAREATDRARLARERREPGGA